MNVYERFLTRMEGLLNALPGTTSSMSQGRDVAARTGEHACQRAQSAGDEQQSFTASCHDAESMKECPAVAFMVFDVVGRVFENGEHLPSGRRRL